MKDDKILLEIKSEFEHAESLYPKFHSNHEGDAVIKEEMDELWDEIKKEKGTKGNEAMKKELIQVGAMVLRFLNDLY